MTYEAANSLPVLIAVNVAFYLSLIALGYCALKFKDNGWRFGIGMMLAFTTAIAILCIFVKIMLIVPQQK
jgi:hypothetical protein